MGRRVFLKKMAAEKALAAWRKSLRQAGWQLSGDETLPVADAIGRVTAAPVFALANAPSFPSCAMDGIAVKSYDTFGATESSPVTLTKEQFVAVNTGNPVPASCDAVIMVEKLNEAENGGVVIHEAMSPWRNVRQVGENAVKGAMLLPTNTVITPAAAALFLSAGVLEVAVRRRAKVAVIPTGDELTPPDEPQEGKVPETNSTLISATLKLWGMEPTVWPIVRDNRQAIKEAVFEAAEACDMVLLNAGSSAGTKDYSADIVQESGELTVHGVELRPGKPLLLGVVKGKAIAGLPGYPVAALVDLDYFVKPLLFSLCGKTKSPEQVIEAVAASTISSKLGDEEHLRGKLTPIDGVTHFTPLPRGSAALGSAVEADGVALISPETEGVMEGEKFKVRLTDTCPPLDQSLIAVGSHSLLLHTLANELRTLDEPLFLTSIHVGSMGGVRAMARRRATLAGIHLLEPDSGKYNLPFISKYLSHQPVGLLHLCKREQGLMVQPGNPKKLSGLACLERDDVRFINRQQGSGTRILLDIKLGELALKSSSVKGYDREETNHVAVALRVARGAADCGLGIRAAANALGLDFIPIEEEQYDLLVDESFFGSEHFSWLVETIKSSTFRQKAQEIGGYDVSSSGEILLSPGDDC